MTAYLHVEIFLSIYYTYLNGECSGRHEHSWKLRCGDCVMK